MTVSFLLTACQAAKVESGRGGVAEGEKAQDFTLKDLKGNSVSMGSFFGKKALLLDFTTTWCPHCVNIIPTLKDIHTNYKGVEVVAVYINESKQTLEKFVERHGIPYTILLDADGSVSRKYGIMGVPTVMVTDKGGIIKFIGHHISSDIIDKAIE